MLHITLSKFMLEINSASTLFVDTIFTSHSVYYTVLFFPSMFLIRLFYLFMSLFWPSSLLFSLYSSLHLLYKFLVAYTRNNCILVTLIRWPVGSSPTSLSFIPKNALSNTASTFPSTISLFTPSLLSRIDS